MTPDEKSKLYKAIGYQEGDIPPKYPIEFVEHKLSFKLKEIVVRIIDDVHHTQPVILLASLQNVIAQLERRPAASAIK